MIDPKDERILQARTQRWDERQGPRVGDFVIMKDGSIRRFTHDWGDALQTTCQGQVGLFYFNRSGHMSYSGNLDRSIPKHQLKDTGKKGSGRIWFFHHDEVRGHNAVYAMVNCRVYRQQKET